MTRDRLPLLVQPAAGHALASCRAASGDHTLTCCQAWPADGNAFRPPTGISAVRRHRVLGTTHSQHGE